jgi:hypothetical protein
MLRMAIFRVAFVLEPTLRPPTLYTMWVATPTQPVNRATRDAKLTANSQETE